MVSVVKFVVKFAVVLVLVLVLLLVVDERLDARAGLGRLDLDLLERLRQVLRSPRTREVAAVREAEVLRSVEVVAHRRLLAALERTHGGAGDGDAPGEGRYGHGVHAVVGVGRRRGGLGSEGLLLRLSPRQYDLWVKRLLLLLLLWWSLGTNGGAAAPRPLLAAPKGRCRCDGAVAKGSIARESAPRSGVVARAQSSSSSFLLVPVRGSLGVGTRARPRARTPRAAPTSIARGVRTAPRSRRSAGRPRRDARLGTPEPSPKPRGGRLVFHHSSLPRRKFKPARGRRRGCYKRLRRLPSAHTYDR